MNAYDHSGGCGGVNTAYSALGATCAGLDHCTGNSGLFGFMVASSTRTGVERARQSTTSAVQGTGVLPLSVAIAARADARCMANAALNRRGIFAVGQCKVTVVI